MENSLFSLVLVVLSAARARSWLLFIRFDAVHREYDIGLTCFTVRATLEKAKKVTLFETQRCINWVAVILPNFSSFLDKVAEFR